MGRLTSPWSFALAAAALMTSACSQRPPVQVVPDIPPYLLEVPLHEWPALADDGDAAGLVSACEGSVNYLSRVPADRVFSFADHQRTAAELVAGVAKFCSIIGGGKSDESIVEQLKHDFVLLRSVGRDGQGEVLYTAYFEPLMEGRKNAEPGFEHAIYAIPDDLLTIRLADFGVDIKRKPLVGRVDERRVVPYWDRESIDYSRVLGDRAAPLAFLADPVQLFFLHVQGSGTVRFPDGELLRAGYAATNGRPYRSIGKLLIDEGLVSREEMSMQAIVGYLEEYPDEVRRVLSANPSYVFFRPLPAAGGPFGCYEIPVTAYRSIATDRRLFPAPVPAFISTSLPSTDGLSNQQVSRFVLNQDTGGSIVGPGRVDLFLGLGDEAGAIAGRTKHLGELYILLPR